MKFTVQFKDPDGPYECIQDAAKRSLPEGLDAEEREAVRVQRLQKINDLTRRWFKYGEYVSIEIDTDAMTATVLEAK